MPGGNEGVSQVLIFSSAWCSAIVHGLACLCSLVSPEGREVEHVHFIHGETMLDSLLARLLLPHLYILLAGYRHPQVVDPAWSDPLRWPLQYARPPDSGCMSRCCQASFLWDRGSTFLAVLNRLPFYP